MPRDLRANRKETHLCLPSLPIGQSREALAPQRARGPTAMQATFQRGAFERRNPAFNSCWAASLTFSGLGACSMAGPARISGLRSERIGVLQACSMPGSATSAMCDILEDGVRR